MATSQTRDPCPASPMSTAATCRIARRSVHVEDRGYQFSDGVYEVCEVRGRAPRRRAPPHGPAGALARANCASRMPMPRSALGVVLRETVRAQPGARRHRLSADHARRGAARPCVSAARHGAERRRHGANYDLDKLRAGGRRGHRGHHRAGKPLGRASTSSRSRCCPTCWPSRRRASRAPRRPGSSTPRAASPKAPRRNAWIVTRDGTVVTRPADYGILRGHHPHGACST